jgi:hypothetical protein
VMDFRSKDASDEDLATSIAEMTINTTLVDMTIFTLPSTLTYYSLVHYTGRQVSE